jgi:hypothetical protein
MDQTVQGINLAKVPVSIYEDSHCEKTIRHEWLQAVIEITELTRIMGDTMTTMMRRNSIRLDYPSPAVSEKELVCSWAVPRIR